MWPQDGARRGPAVAEAGTGAKRPDGLTRRAGAPEKVDQGVGANGKKDERSKKVWLSWGGGCVCGCADESRSSSRLLRKADWGSSRRECS